MEVEYSHFIVQFLYLLVYTEAAAGLIILIALKKRLRSTVDRPLRFFITGIIACGFFLSVQVFLDAVGFMEILQETQQSRITFFLNTLTLCAIGLIWTTGIETSRAFCSLPRDTVSHEGFMTRFFPSSRAIVRTFSLLILLLILGIIILQARVLLASSLPAAEYLIYLQTAGAVLFIFTHSAAAAVLLLFSIKSGHNSRETGLLLFILTLLGLVFFPAILFLTGESFGMFAAPGGFLLLNTLGLLTLFIRSRRSSPDPAVDITAICRSLGLTKRETEVAVLLAEGRSYREIGSKLFVSMATVQTHVGRIYAKLGINNKTQLANRLTGRSN